MSDALISTPVATVAGVAAVALIAVATQKAKRSERTDRVALMGVLGAFVFVAQMINFTIPGTGSSGHIVGGILLSALLGPWCGFLTLCSVLIVQCLVFADGGLMALGCNIINMAAMSCLVAYPLIFRPIVRGRASAGRLIAASVLSSIVALELGALLVTLATVGSGVTALSLGGFLSFMLPIHLIIGACEGVATGLVLTFVARQSPALLQPETAVSGDRRRNMRVVIIFAAVAVVLGCTFMFIASELPDGLEWSVMHLTDGLGLPETAAPATAFLPDYDSHLSGIVGGLIVLATVWALTAVIFRKQKVATRR